MVLVPTVFLILHLGITVASFVRTVTAVRRLRAQPFLERSSESPGHSEQTTTLISIIIPVRNEEHNIVTCLRGVLTQQGSRIEVLVVDDHSEDGTLDLARAIARDDPRIVVMRSAELPAGWTGKNYALHQGVSVATGEWLLFTDADVVLAPHALAVALRFAESNRLDLLSLSPRQCNEGFWERLLQPIVFQLLTERFDMRVVNDPRTNVAAANGQFILMRRSAYLQVGGHQSVWREILEDVALARLTKQARLRIFFANTRSLAEARMYRGLKEIWEGWGKNLVELLNSSDTSILTVALRELLLRVAPFVSFPLSLWLSAYNTSLESLMVLSGALAVVCVLAGGAHVRRITHGFPRYSFVLPVGEVMLVALIFTSWYRCRVRGRTVWKGRMYER